MRTVRDDGKKSEKVCMLDERLFSTPADKRTEDYISGRFG